MSNTKSLSAKTISMLLLFGLLLSNLAFSTSISSSALTVGSWSDDINIDWYDEDLDSYQINNGQELAGFAKLVNDGNDFQDKVIELNSDIDLGSHYWMPIGNDWNISFSGTFKGQNHKIKNMKIGENESNPFEEEYVGLFGHVQYANISGIYIDKNSRIYAKSSVIGGIVGLALNSIISNCTNNASIHSSDIVDINSDYSAGGTCSAGGICGTLGTKSKIVECFNNGDITSSFSGGICSTNLFSVIERCTNNGRISAFEGIIDGFQDMSWCSAGGIVNESISGKIIGCASYGEIYIESPNRLLSRAGGIVAESKSSEIRACTNSAVVSAGSSPNEIGGIVGYAYDRTEIRHCNNHGDVSSSADNLNTDNNLVTSKIGGICGKFLGDGGGVIDQSCNDGKISSENDNAYIGGIIGELTGQVTIGKVAFLLKGYPSISSSNFISNSEIKNIGHRDN